MKVLVDTNVLLRFANPNQPDFQLMIDAVNALLGQGHELGHTPQARRELWSVVTRPKDANGLGADPGEANRMLKSIDSSISLWDHTPGIAAEWQKLVVALDVRGVQVHDANHAAAAIWHSATHVLTRDSRDFERFRRFGLLRINPEDV